MAIDTWRIIQDFSFLCLLPSLLNSVCLLLFEAGVGWKSGCVGGGSWMGGKVLHLLTQRHTQTGAEALAYLCKFMIAPFPFFTVSYSPRHCYWLSVCRCVCVCLWMFVGVSGSVSVLVCVCLVLLLLLVAYPVTGIIVWPPRAELHFSCLRALLFLLCDFLCPFFKSNAACSWLLSTLDNLGC